MRYRRTKKRRLLWPGCAIISVARYDGAVLHFLRIAVTALCLPACVLLVALWVRSYWWVDAVYIAQTYSAGSMQGDMYVMPGIYNSTPAHVVEHDIGPIHIRSIRNADGKTVFRIDGRVVPIWILVLSIAALAAIPWLRWRFSLRTLLIAMTLVAVALGVIVTAMW
jgi:hypothetical protein